MTAELPNPRYKSFIPDTAGLFPVQWETCFAKLTSYLADGTMKAFRVHVFIRTDGKKDFDEKHDMIRQAFDKAFGQPSPPLNILPQAPELPADVIIEAGFYPVSEAQVIYRSCCGSHYCQVTAGSYVEHWFTGIRGDLETTDPGTVAAENGGTVEATGPASAATIDLRESADMAFNALQTLFENTGLSMDGIVRQWNYIGGILDRRMMNGNMVQHYQLFNESRYACYSKYRLAKGYPAATGIGMDEGSVVLDCCVISGNEDVSTCAVSNPDQHDSYAYDQDVLVGSAGIESGKVKHPPQFERALLIRAGNRSRLLISGTASIRGQKNVAEGDVLQQTRITLENIRHLASAENLMAQCPALEVVPEKHTYARVYVKYQGDIGRIRSVCRDYFGDAPLTFVQADICRDDLLVEIETELIV